MATTVGSEYRMLIGGDWVDSDGGTFEVTNPVDDEAIATVPNATAEDVTRAIDAADEALPAWRALAAVERARILRRAADNLRAETDHIGGVMTDEQGKPLAEAKGEVDYAASFFEWFAGEAERIYGQVLPPLKAEKRVLVLRQPVGVTAAITPWNFPAAMLARKLAPALAAGCTSVVKPASATPLTALEVGRVLEESGVPGGVVNIVTSRRTRRRLRHALPRPARAQAVVHRLHRGREGADPRLGRPGQAPVARARRPCAVHHLRRRRPRGRARRHHRLQVPQRRPDLHLREPHLRAAGHP